MHMKFSIKDVVDSRNLVHNVELSLEISTTDRECMYLKANGKTIMGFKRGMYCRYTDAKDSCTGDGIQGLLLDRIGKIIEADNNF